MNSFSLALTALLGVALSVVIAPNIFALNRGKSLRNIALWLAIALALGLVYQNFGPGKTAPAGLSAPSAQAPAEAGSSASDDDRNAPDDDAVSYTPPKE